MDTPRDDLTPLSGSPTDVSPLGRSVPPPAHVRTAAEEAGAVDWGAIAALPAFKELIRVKLRFIVPTTVFFVVYYFALPILVGWYPELMARKLGGINYAYLFALSQFFMAWIVAAIYVVKASGWDRRAADVLKSAGHR